MARANARAFVAILRAMVFTLPSFAKINWTLRVLGQRSDGYHELFTIFQTVSLHDTLSFTEASDLSLACDDPAIPTDSRNLIMKAADLLAMRSGSSGGASIKLQKRIPSPAGMGGGSSNAAVALIGLDRLWNTRAAKEDLLSIARTIGSDVPFFLTGGTAEGTGRGEMIAEVGDAFCDNILIVTPSIDIPTAEVFRGYSGQTLTMAERDTILTVCRNGVGSLDPRRFDLVNDLERTVRVAYPEIGEVKRALLELRAVSASMSGSGASVFAIFDNQETRQTAMKALDRRSTWRKFAVATISRGEYRTRLGLTG